MSTPGPVASQPPPKAPIPTDPREIEAEIVARQVRLAATVDELTRRLSPKEVARRTSSDLQVQARTAVYAEDGSLRVERLAAVVAALAAVLAWVLWRRREQDDRYARARAELRRRRR
jgi:hypothetical protein